MSYQASLPAPDKAPLPRRAVDTIIYHPVLYWAIAGILLFTLQVLVTGTSMAYSALVGIFVLATGITVHLLGGITQLPGACVLLLALQHVLISQVAKLVFGDPADAPLSQPIMTMLVYIVGMCSLMVGAILVRRWQLYARLRPIFRAEQLFNGPPTRLLMMTLVTTVLAILRQLVILVFGINEDNEAVSGGILGPLKTMELLTSFSVALSTAYVVQTSQRKRSLSVINALALLPPILIGILGTGRAAMAMSIAVYICTSLAFGYRFRLKHYIVLGIGTYILYFVLFPYAVAARGFVRTPNLEEKVRQATTILTDVILNPGKYQVDEDTSFNKMAEDRRRRLYYDTPQPTLGRYSVLISVDAIVDATLDEGTTGMETIRPGFDMLLPRFLNPDKPIYATSNMLAHRASGLVGAQDFTTGITLGFFADAFSSYSWLGLLLIPLILLLVLVVVFQKLSGCSIKRNPYALAFVFTLPWSFSENTIATAMLTLIQGALIIFVTFFLIRTITVLVSPQYGDWQSGEKA